MQAFFSSNDWRVEESPIRNWGYNAKGTFYLVVERDFGNGPKPWTMNVPKGKVGNLPNLLEQLSDEQRQLLRFTGGWICGNAEITVGLAVE